MLGTEAYVGAIAGWRRGCLRNSHLENVPISTTSLVAMISAFLVPRQTEDWIWEPDSNQEPG